VASGSFLRKAPPEIAGTGYVVKSLEAALWAFHQGQSFAECCLLAVNLGDDADTTGAICGQLAGAYYGAKGIPPEWLARLALREQIVELANRLYGMAGLR
jgi:ADP-ribosyl-[dinitrogen reductase] hydrolase